MADTQQSHSPADADGPSASRADARAGRQAARLARHIQSFAKRHGGSAEGHIAHIGRRGARIVLIGADGGWGDLVAPTPAVARRATDEAGITVHDTFGGETAAKLRTGPYEWSRMAGIQLGGTGRR